MTCTGRLELQGKAESCSHSAISSRWPARWQEAVHRAASPPHTLPFRSANRSWESLYKLDASPFFFKHFVQLLLNHHLLSLVMGDYANGSATDVPFIFEKFNQFYHHFDFLKIYI